MSYQSEFLDVEDIQQVWGEDTFKARFNKWKEDWDIGLEGGIVGGNKFKSAPNTVIGQAYAHGKSEFSRTGEAFRGLGYLLKAVENLLDGDTVTEKDITNLKMSVKLLDQVVKNSSTNPRNIPFHTVVKFTAPTEEGAKPIVKRGKVRGHYRTKAYNDWATWENENNPTRKNKLKIASTDSSWYNLEGKKESAKPPLYSAIADRKNGLLGLGKSIDKGLKTIKISGSPTMRVRRTPGKLAQIESVQKSVREILSRRDIYPAGAVRKPQKDRLNKAFNEETFAIKNKQEAEHLDFVKGASRIANLSTLKEFKLSFPPNNIALNKLIYEVMKDEVDTFESPKAKEGTAKPGIELKGPLDYDVDAIQKGQKRKDERGKKRPQWVELVVKVLKEKNDLTSAEIMTKLKRMKNSAGRPYKNIPTTREMTIRLHLLLDFKNINKGSPWKKGIWRYIGDNEDE